MYWIFFSSLVYYSINRYFFIVLIHQVSIFTPQHIKFKIKFLEIIWNWLRNYILLNNYLLFTLYEPVNLLHVFLTDNIDGVSKIVDEEVQLLKY